MQVTPGQLSILRANVYLDCGCGQLEKAILCRSTGWLNRILPNWEQHTNSLGIKLSPLELALGWHSGLQRLLEAGFNATNALCLSIHMEDFESTSRLLAADSFPGNDHLGWTTVLQEVQRSNMKAIRDLVVASLAHRRRSLAQLAKDSLPVSDLVQLGVLKEKVLDSAAFNVYSRLLENGVDIPPSLVPALYCSVDEKEHQSIYLSLFDPSYIPCATVLETFFQQGFESVDTSDADRRTPLLVLCEKFVQSTWTDPGIDCWPQRSINSLHWLLEKGACPEFTLSSSFPNVIFYVAILYRCQLRYGRPPLTSLFNCLLRRSITVCNPLDRDGCRCYCSEKGCLPLHKLWKCNEGWHYHEGCKSSTRKSLSHNTAQWARLGGLDEEQCQLYGLAYCRLEVFERLGMAHTCCAFFMNARRTLMPKEDQMYLQEEDVELKQQLELIIEAYKRYRRRCTSDSHEVLDLWWRKLDEILPELKPEERCKRRCLNYWDYQAYKGSATYAQEEAQLQQDRARVEGDALAKNGYTGLDFIDVIRTHFADLVEVESSQTRSSVNRPLLRRSQSF